MHSILRLNRRDWPYTQGQRDALEGIADFMHDPVSSAQILAGYAGTGKTTILENIFKYATKIGRMPMLLSLTNRAVQVMHEKFDWAPPEAFSTLHSLLYGPPDSSGSFRIGKPREILDKGNFFIVDESSMVPEDIMEDILRAGTKNLAGQVLFVGDSFQLRPIGDDPGLLEEPNYQLDEVVRYDSDLLALATAVRKTEQVIIPQENMQGVSLISGEASLKALSFLKEDIPCKMITGTNASRVSLNKRIREGLKPDEQYGTLVKGDILISISNNAYYTNGAFFEIAEAEVEGATQYVTIDNFKRRTTEIYQSWQVKDTSGKSIRVLLFPDTLLPSIYNTQVPELKLDDGWDMGTVIATYGWAISCHKSQGGEWAKVVLHLNSFFDDPRWYYTAITRAQEEVILNLGPMRDRDVACPIQSVDAIRKLARE